MIPRLALGAVTAALVAGGSVGCTPKSTLGSGWTRTRVDYGAGQVIVGARSLWVAVKHPHGALIKTPEGGRALLRVFNCGRSSKHVRGLLRSRLRDQLLSSEFVERGRVFAFRWRKKRPPRRVHWTAIKRHGPLMLAVSSQTIPLDDVVEVAKRINLVVPVPSIKGCLPLCELSDSKKCKAQSSED